MTNTPEEVIKIYAKLKESGYIFTGKDNAVILLEMTTKYNNLISESEEDSQEL